MNRDLQLMHIENTALVEMTLGPIRPSIIFFCMLFTNVRRRKKCAFNKPACSLQIGCFVSMIYSE